MKTVRIPDDALRKYYNDLAEFSKILEYLKKSGIKHEVNIDALTGYKFIQYGDTDRSIYIVKADEGAYLPENRYKFFPAELLSEKRVITIGFSNNNIIPGQSVGIYIITPCPIYNVEVHLENIKTKERKQLYIFSKMLYKGMSDARWTTDNDIKLGEYRAVLIWSEYESKRKESVSSVSVLKVITDTGIRLGRCFLPDGTEHILQTVKALREEQYHDEKRKEEAFKKLVLFIMENSKTEKSYAVIDTAASGSNKMGMLKLMTINNNFSIKDLHIDGNVKTLLPPSPQELAELESKNIKIESIIICNYIQLRLIFNENGIAFYKCADLISENYNLDEEVFLKFKFSNQIKHHPFPIESIKEKHINQYILPPEFSQYIQIKLLLKLSGYTITEGCYDGKIAIRVYPKNSRQKVSWIEFTESRNNYTAQGAFNDIEKYGKDRLRIMAPLLTSSAVIKQGDKFEIYVDIPNRILSGEQPDISQILQNNIKICFPEDNKRPFKNKVGSEVDNVCLIVEDYKKLERGDKTEEKEIGRFYQGTIPKKGDFAEEAEYVSSSGREDWEEYSPMYYRRYPGLIDDCENLFRVSVRLSRDINPGVYNLKVQGTDDDKVHPLTVFDKNKSKYSFMQLSDVHIAKRYDRLKTKLSPKTAKKYVNPNENFVKYAKEASAYDFVVITGDLIEFVNDHRPFESDFVMDSNWMFAEELIMENFSVPVFIVLGNHDYRHNPVSAGSVSKDINLSEEEAKAYPRDMDEDYLKWITGKYLEDVLFSDTNALQYYFYYFCPFHDYSFTLDKLNFIFLDSKFDMLAFFNDYALKERETGVKYAVAAKIIHDNPAPMTKGFEKKQIDYLDSVLKDFGIVFMHSALINMPYSIPQPLVYPKVISEIPGWEREYIPERNKDIDIINMIFENEDRILTDIGREISSLIACLVKPIIITPAMYVIVERLIFLLKEEEKHRNIYNFFDLIKNGSIYIFGTTVLGKEKNTYFDESSVLYFRDELVKRMATDDNRRIKMVVSGHVHKNMEFILKATDKTRREKRWFIGDFSGHNKPGTKVKDATYAVATVSGGYLGYRWVKKDGFDDEFDIDAYKKEFYGTGYRTICITKDGVIESMNVVENTI